MEKLTMAWVDYKKTCGMVPQSWIIHCLKMFKISGEVIKFIENTRENWRTGGEGGKKLT